MPGIPHSTPLRIGKYVDDVKNDVYGAFLELKKIKYYVLGNGTNVLACDETFNGVANSKQNVYILIDDYKKILNDTKPQISELEISTGYEALSGQIEELEMHTQQPDFWNDVENSQKISQKIGELKNVIA